MQERYKALQEVENWLEGYVRYQGQRRLQPSTYLKRFREHFKPLDDQGRAHWPIQTKKRYS